MDDTMRAIIDNNMILVSAQPDEVYFHWQVELYLYQFAKHGISDRCYAIFGYKGDAPSEQLRRLSTQFEHIIWYKDDRVIPSQHHYIPTIRPHLLKKFFKEHPSLGKNVFYHDSDVLLVHMPKFELMLSDDVAYLSDTVGYIGANYIKKCCERYQGKYAELPTDDLFIKMCACVGVSTDLIERNEPHSGGAQYLLKDVDYHYWENVEETCSSLYHMLKTYEQAYPIDHHIQSWTTDMWVVLWLYWKLNKQTKLHKELDFSWGTWSIDKFETRNIFHLAGVTAANCSDKFYKANYTQKNVLDAYKKNAHLFDHVSPVNATYGYIALIKEYVGERVARDDSIRQFTISAGKHFDGTYVVDDRRLYFDRPSWRSNDGVNIIFYNGTSWILTASKYENEISATCGGYACNHGEYPFVDEWR